MSNLIISLEKFPAPSADCLREPPAPGPGQPTDPDGCYFVLPLVDEQKPQAQGRTVRFDRSGDGFVLSNINSSDNLTWVGGHQNLSQILEVLRLTEATIRGNAIMDSADTAAIKVMMAQFIVTGVIRFLDNHPFPLQKNGSGRRTDLANFLLGSFTISRPQIIKEYLGTLAVFRADQKLTQAAKDRIQWVNSIMDLVPKHKMFRNHFIGKKKVDPWRNLKASEQDILRPLFYFSRKIVVGEWLNQPLRYDQDFYRAFQSYKKLWPKNTKPKQKAQFCKKLRTALNDLRGPRGGFGQYLKDCQLSLDLIPLKKEEAIKTSIYLDLIHQTTWSDFEKVVAAESKKAQMSMEWLGERGRIQEVVRILIKHLQIQLPKLPGGEIQLKLDVDSFLLSLKLSASSKISVRREYLLISLALLRKLFLSGKGRPRQRSFVEGEFRALPWDLAREEIQAIRDAELDLMRQLKVSHGRSDRLLPLLEGITCAAGGVALVANEVWGNEDSGSHRRFGMAGSGVAGLGCGSLAGHYVFPKFKNVRNHYWWDGLSGLGGSLLGMGLYFVIHRVAAPYQDPSRNPVDEYGP